jgi:hypothetical protein
MNPKQPLNPNHTPPNIVSALTSDGKPLANNLPLPDNSPLNEFITKNININPNVLNKIRELDTTFSVNATELPQPSSIPISTTTKPYILRPNPFRESSGLYFRDILKQPNTRSRKL